jgi:hypothetical protein
MLYRTAPRLPWGVYYVSWVLAINNYNSYATAPSGSATPVTLSVLGTNCYSGQQCELLPLSSIARVDVGNNSASVVVVQGSQQIAGPQTVSGVNYYCVFNLPVSVTATYPGPVSITIANPLGSFCNGVNQYCDVGPFYRFDYFARCVFYLFLFCFCFVLFGCLFLFFEVFNFLLLLKQ